MEIKSLNIFGITGGIGTSFVELVDDKKILIRGYYYKDSITSAAITNRFTNVEVKQIDLSDQFVLDKITIPNYEGLLFLAGEPHFSTNVFDFEISQLRNQANINFFSFLGVIKSVLKYDNPALKKIVFISSDIPDEIKSIYHLTKVIQEKAIELLRPELNRKGISISIIRTGWVDTKMYASYLSRFNLMEQEVKHPSIIAKVCLAEFQDTHIPFKTVAI